MNPLRNQFRSALAIGVLATACAGGEQQPSGFARSVADLSEPGGFFDTDNLISNEKSYLHVAGDLARLGVSGGAYVGVGPDQNFSYIAMIRPEVAYIVDIRRDNMLEHLIYKAAFQLSANRAGFLSVLLGLPGEDAPEGIEDWSVDRLVDHIDARFASEASISSARHMVDSVILGLGMELSDRDWTTIDRFHRVFIRSGLSLRFTTLGRAPQPYYPTYRQLLRATDREGRQAGYLATAKSFSFIKGLEERDLIIPVVGDFVGNHALTAVAADIDRRGVSLSAFYTSNVEFYLMREGTFSAFAANLARFPIDSSSVFIRSLFNSTARFVHPQSEPGFASTQLVQSVAVFRDAWSAGSVRTYSDVMLMGGLSGQ